MPIPRFQYNAVYLAVSYLNPETIAYICSSNAQQHLLHLNTYHHLGRYFRMLHCHRPKTNGGSMLLFRFGLRLAF
jgi:hypothetical protein